MINVLHIIETLGRGGAERQLLNLIQSHQGLAIRHAVVALSGPLDLAADLRALDVPVTCLERGAMRDLPGVVIKLSDLISASRPMLIHTWLPRADWAGRIAAKRWRLPVVSAVQSPLYSPDVLRDNPAYKPWKLAIVREIDRWTGRLAKARYVGCSPYVSALTAQSLGVGDVATIVNSVPALPGRHSPFNATAPRFLHVGRLSPEKGQRYLLQAFAAVVRRHPQATLALVGTGPLEAELRTLIATLGLERHVALLGARDDVPALLAASDAFVFPSLWEGLGVAAVEALVVGLPTIASAIPALSGLIEDGATGLLVPPGDAEALAAAIERLITDPAHADRLGQAARAAVWGRYTLEGTAEQWLALYRELAPPPNAHAAERSA